MTDESDNCDNLGISKIRMYVCDDGHTRVEVEMSIASFRHTGHGIFQIPKTSQHGALQLGGWNDGSAPGFVPTATRVEEAEGH